MHEYDFSLGNHHFEVTTASALAQRWFDRGLVWIYGFNHNEAAACFRKAAQADPQLAMAYWGEAYACGPFYNMTWDKFSAAEAAEATAVCHAATRTAQRLAPAAHDVEQALIEALCARFQKPKPVSLEQFAQWEDDYVMAMRQVHDRYPDHCDIAALFSEALITRTPWRLWNVETGEPAAGAHTDEALGVIERAIARRLETGEPDHAGLLHNCIHALKMSPHPERAMGAADRLPNTSPDNGHLQRMPAHVYVLCGRYSDAIEVSNRAIEADDKYVAHAGMFDFTALNRCHDVLMKIHAAMLAGHRGEALSGVDALLDRLSEELLQIDKPYLVMLLEGYLASVGHVNVRFGLWEDILAKPGRTDASRYPITIAMEHYTRGIACSSLGRLEEAEHEQTQLDAVTAGLSDELILGNNPVADVLAVGQAMLSGELEYRRGGYGKAFAALRTAVRLSDELAFSEPWPWMHPPRHALGALLMEQGEYEDAEAVYRTDLGLDDAVVRCQQHPGNVWSLHGLAECLRRKTPTAELEALELELEAALGYADISIKASCCCRRSVSW